jgi:peptidoglycan-N-acetylglucosamine deacetylase
LKFIQPPYFAKRYYPEAIWRFSILEKKIFLTFDDGPHPTITPKVLSLLEKYNAKATFFCVGENVKNHPAIYQTLLASKHSVGNHTFNHLNGWKNSLLSYARNIEKAAECINSKLFRPPYGKMTQKQYSFLEKHQFKLIMWDVLTYDWAELKQLDKHYIKMTKAISNGSIVVFHDSEKAEANMFYLLEKLLSDYSKKGYKFEGIEL